MERPLIIAHRAKTGAGPENTLSAIRAAAAAGADLIELDVRLTLDRVPVVIHDPLLGRTTSGHGPLALWPSRLLRRITLREADERVPTVGEVLRDIPETAMPAFHVKARGALGPVITAIRKEGDPARTWLWLERARDVHRATQALPGIHCTLLRPGGWTPAYRAVYFREAQLAGAQAVSIASGGVTPDLADLAHRHHLLVFSRIDHVSQLPSLVANGLDGAITADPAGARDLLAQTGHPDTRSHPD